MLPPTAAPADRPPGGQFHQVLGRSLYLDRAGTGAPPVVWLPGAGMFSHGYHNVHQLAARRTTSVIYDRAGTGWSDSALLPSLAEVVHELHALLETAGLQGPVILAGHSLGGLYARRYAQLYPAEVAGLLLLDPAHEDFDANLSPEARAFQEGFKNQPRFEITPEVVEAYRPIMAAMYATWPAEIRDPLIARHLSPARLSVGLDEGANVDRFYQEIRQGPPLAGVPLIVLTAMGIDASQRMFSPEPIIVAQNAAKLATAEALVRSVPGAENRVLDDASHAMMHGQRPDAVDQALGDLLARIRA